MSTELALALHRIGRPRCLIIGDFILDRTLDGHFTRFAQENGAVPVFKTDVCRECSGGSGAVGQMAKALGAEVEWCCGGESSYDMTIKTRYYVDGQLVFRADRDEQVPAESEERTLRNIREKIDKTDVVLIADYGRGTCTDTVLRAAIDGAKARGIPCLVDPHGNEWSRYTGCTAIKCNTHEVRSWQSGVFDHYIVTRGEYGMHLNTIKRGGVETQTFATRHRRVVDVTGAGDCVLSAIGVCLSSGMSWQDACKVANASAGLKVERRGAVPVPRCEVIADLIDSKIIPQELLSAVAAACRSHKILGTVPLYSDGSTCLGMVPRKVVWTNGCFDGGLHAGHLHLLAEAKKQGNVLIVGVNDDESVYNLKGIGRPLRPCKDRCEQVAALSCVDYVVSFEDQEQLAACVKAVAPDVLCVGSDYLNKPVVGMDDAGRLHFVQKLRGYSTTAELESYRVQISPL